ncbi:pyridoxal phosphate-dependent transferase [Sordaria brevicollis]|uniref:Pyridoxal phosphate-dependent transferase n=1 Tax=Sordaria brevicollis TaxID=83679 RepID=A0AAE0PP37_SORBR|nr:pyridoxal phosphate-dependent transferase [Sordaria brevicollis]
MTTNNTPYQTLPDHMQPAYVDRILKPLESKISELLDEFCPANQGTDRLNDVKRLVVNYVVLQILTQTFDPNLCVTPRPKDLAHAEAWLENYCHDSSIHLGGEPPQITGLAGHGKEFYSTLTHILADIVPALNSQALSSRYYGFVTGGVHPVAQAADNVVTALDQNVQVHMPQTHSISTVVEHHALSMLRSLLGLDGFEGKTFTTGATASNIMGLACGREAVIAARLPPGSEGGVGEMGILGACMAAGVREVQVLTSKGHSSLYKAASVVGLGRAAVKDLGLPDRPWALDLKAVERELKREGVASIIVVSAGEVNTGQFGTTGEDMKVLRQLADRYKAWIHVDGAFGIFARALPKDARYAKLRERTAGLELADSIAADGHKLLNVPYDCGIFFSSKPEFTSQVFQNPNAAYLAPVGSTSGSGTNTEIPGPLHIGLENSRRFRALPVYALLLHLGRENMGKMFARMVDLARRIAAFIRESDKYDLLPDGTTDDIVECTHIIVLFKAKDPKLNEVLVEKINETRRMFVSPTKWKGENAVRLAVGSWKVDVEEDLAAVSSVLNSL